MNNEEFKSQVVQNVISITNGNSKINDILIDFITAFNKSRNEHKEYAINYDILYMYYDVNLVKFGDKQKVIINVFIDFKLNMEKRIKILTINMEINKQYPLIVINNINEDVLSCSRIENGEDFKKYLLDFLNTDIKNLIRIHKG